MVLIQMAKKMTREHEIYIVQLTGRKKYVFWCLIVSNGGTL